MQFEPDELYDWLNAWEDRAKHVLASSGMASTSTQDLGIDGKLFEGSLGYGPLPVMPALHSKVAQTFGVAEDRTLVTLAGSEADLLGIWATVKPGDKVVVENPTYPPLRAIPKALGCKVALHQRTFANRFRLDLGKLERELKGAKLLCVSNVNNPTGVSISKRELEELHDIAEKRKCTVLVDEAFRELSFVPLPIAASLGDRFVSTSTLTKMYGLGGLRTGWLFGAKKLVQRALTAKEHTSIGQPVLEQRVAMVALEQRMELLARGRRIRDANFAILHRWASTHPKLRWVEPDGAPVCFPLLPKGVDDARFGKRLVEERSTLVVPGRYQGLKQHFRLGWGMEPGGLEPGLREIDAMLRA